MRAASQSGRRKDRRRSEDIKPGQCGLVILTQARVTNRRKTMKYEYDWAATLGHIVLGRNASRYHARRKRSVVHV